MQVKWTVDVSNRAKKQLAKVPSIVKTAFVALVKDLEDTPYQIRWNHYGKLQGLVDCYHCHILSSRPTYVVCWEIKNKTIHVIEVYYVGTHENAPYQGGN